MGVKYYLVVLVILLGSMSVVVSGQTNCKQISKTDRLPALSEPIGCALTLKYLDDALEKARSSESNIILIVRMKNPQDLSLARTRSKNLRNYIRFRDFKNFEVVFDLETNEADQIDLYVQGELLYSLPIKRKDKLEFTDC